MKICKIKYLKFFLLVNNLDCEALNLSKDAFHLLDYYDRHGKYKEYKLIKNFWSFLSSIDEIYSTNKTHETSQLDFILSDINIHDGLNSDFLVFLVAFYIYKDICNDWCFSNTDNWMIFPIDKLLNKSQGRLRSILQNILEVYNIKNNSKIGFEFFLSYPETDNDFNFYFLRYSLSVSAILCIKYYGLAIKRSKLQIYGSGNYPPLELKHSTALVIDPILLSKIGPLEYDYSDIKSQPSKIAFYGKNIVSDIINNDKYNKPIWLSNSSLIIDQRSDLHSQTYDINNILNILNYLNKSPVYFSKPIFYEILKLIKIDTDIRESLYMTYGISEISHSDIYCINSINLTIKEISNIIKFKNKFYLDYALDSRGRIYVKNIPINYQLSKFVRSILRTFNTDIIGIYRNFSNDPEINEIINNYKVFYIQQIKPSTFSILLNNTFFQQKINFINQESFIILETILTILYRLGFKPLESIDTIILNGITIFDEITKDNILNLAKKLSKSKKKIIETLTLLLGILEWKNKPSQYPKIMWYNDASANALQLLTIKLCIIDKDILKITNIIQNNSEFTDIYDYISKSLKIKYKQYATFISRELIKKRIMPGVYGQTYITFKKEMSKILENDSKWLELDINKKNELTKIIANESWLILGDSGSFILDYLNLCKHVAYEYPEQCSWTNAFGLPVIITKQKNTNRQKIIKDKKRIYAAIKTIEKKSIITKNEISPDKQIQYLLNINNKKNNILKEDEKNNIRKNLYTSIKNLKIKIRYRKKSNKIDINALSNSIAASSNHSDDASILANFINLASKYNIHSTIIHDSVGSNIELSPIIKILFKKSFIWWLEKSLNEELFPINILNLNFKKKNKERLLFLTKLKYSKDKFKKNIEELKKEIYESTNFFN